MKVIKFDGSCILSAKTLSTAKDIISQQHCSSVVVVSAFGQTTQWLTTASKMAERGNLAYLDVISKIRVFHLELIDALPLANKSSCIANVDELFSELENILRGISLINDLSERTTNKIVSYGERLAVVVFHHLISHSKLIDATQLIKTDRVGNSHLYNEDITNRLIHKHLSSYTGVTIVAGFISSSNETGEITNLGRGGSDYTAAIFASALLAEELEIWTNSYGFTTADTSIVKEAYPIAQLTYTEALELSNFDTSIIYPPSIYPVYNKNIPIQIRNIRFPEVLGTRISNTVTASSSKAQIKGISSIKDTCLLTIQGLGMVGIVGVNYRIFRSLAEHNISVFFVSQAASENSTSIGVKQDVYPLAVQVLEQEFATEIGLGTIHRVKVQLNLATVAIVSESMKHTPGIAGKLFSTLGRSGISIISLAQGAAEKNVSFVVHADNLNKALHAIHDAFFLSPYKELNLFIVGIGTVGGSLISQIAQQQQQLMEKHALKINVVGIARGKKALINTMGIDLANYSSLIEREGFDSSPSILQERILQTNIFNAVFVDCTASPDIANIYSHLINNNISVVTANKIAASDSYDSYLNLKKLSRKKDVKFLFETNVGAGLPVISTIHSLIHSGDRVLKIEAVLSGTLNYIFNILSSDISFSQAVWQAKEMGYAEPDPRIDLSGTDVARKLIILAREANYAVELCDVKKELFVPQQLFEGSLEEFWERLSLLDEYFENRQKMLAKENKKLRFVATLNNGICEMGLKEVPHDHPFFDLEGSNNIIQITTERYNEYPMIIKGYGAGASVTAAGVFADIISIANVR